MSRRPGTHWSRAQETAHGAQDARRAAIERACQLIALGLDALQPEGRLHLLRTLIEAIVVRPGVVELHGVLPGEETWPVVGNRPESVQ